MTVRLRYAGMTLAVSSVPGRWRVLCLETPALANRFSCRPGNEVDVHGSQVCLAPATRFETFTNSSQWGLSSLLGGGLPG